MKTIAKGITNATIPMGGVVVREHIHDAILDAAAETAIEFAHGYTYSGHPMATAAALATLDLYRDEGLFERAAGLAPYFEDAAHALRDLTHVVDIRNLGLVAAIELAPRPGSKVSRAFEAFLRCFEAGVLVRAAGDVVAIWPPLIIETDQIDRIFATVAGALKTMA